MTFNGTHTNTHTHTHAHTTHTHTHAHTTHTHTHTKQHAKHTPHKHTQTHGGAPLDEGSARAGFFFIKISDGQHSEVVGAASDPRVIR